MDLKNIINNDKITVTISGSAGLGYAESLKILRDAGIQMQETHNIRINVLVADDEALIYSPTPLIVENPVKESFPNGIIIDYDAVAGLCIRICSKLPERTSGFGLPENRCTGKLALSDDRNGNHAVMSGSRLESGKRR